MNARQAGRFVKPRLAKRQATRPPTGPEDHVPGLLLPYGPVLIAHRGLGEVEHCGDMRNKLDGLVYRGKELCATLSVSSGLKFVTRST
jgi:hypothetical protein